METSSTGVADVGTAADEPPTEKSIISGDSGFGLVEIVISMFLIGVIAISFLPVLVQALTTSARNITIATATQLINEQLDLARGEVSNCSELDAYQAATPAAVIDAQAVTLQPTRAHAVCDDTTLSVVSVTVEVERTDTGAIVATATTLIPVKAAASAPDPESSPEEVP